MSRTADPSDQLDATSATKLAEIRDDPLRFGVGARITVAVMSDRYIEIILGALKQTDSTGLEVKTGDVSTFVTGSESDLLRYLTDLSSGIAQSEAHSAINIQLFRGCPGAIVCDLPQGPGPRIVSPPKGRVVGQFVAAEWALYPLADQMEADHMRDIYAAIDFAVNNGTFKESKGSVTRLEGDLGTVLETVVAGWVQVGRSVQHVASHLTMSVNSPSHKKGGVGSAGP